MTAPRRAATQLGLLVAARSVSVLGTAMTPIALAFAVLALPDGGPGVLGLVLFASALPQVVFMLLGGVIADRFPRSVVMRSAEALAGVTQLATAWLFLTGRATVPALVGLAAVGGVAIALFSPALTGIVPDIAAPERLQSANAYLRLATNITRIAGTAAAGVLVAVAGPAVALAVDGVSYLIAAALLTAIRSPAPAPGTTTAGLVADLRDGWGEFVARRWVVLIVVSFALANAGFSAVVGVLGPVQADTALGGAGPWAAVVTAFSLGTVLGVVLALRLRPRRPMAVAVLAAPVMAVPVAAAAPPLTLPVIVVSAFVAGAASDVFGVLWETALQQHVPRAALSRVSAYDWLGSSALVPLALAVSGLIVDRVGIGTALWLAAGVCLLPGLTILDPQIRRLRPVDHDPTRTPAAA